MSNMYLVVRRQISGGGIIGAFRSRGRAVAAKNTWNQAQRDEWQAKGYAPIDDAPRAEVIRVTVDDTGDVDPQDEPRGYRFRDGHEMGQA